MKPDARILDQNLAQLLKRAYVPVLARPDFRERAGEEWLREWSRSIERRRGRGGAGDRPVREAARSAGDGATRWKGFAWAGLAAAAALLLVVGLFGRREQADVFDAPVFLARGEIAVRDLDAGTWRSAEDPLTLGSVGCELRTPGERTARVIADGGLLELSADAHATLRPEGRGDGDSMDDRSGLEARLERGTLIAERAQGGREWLLLGQHARVRFGHGRLELTRSAAGESALLSEGRARLDHGDEIVALSPGVPVTFGADGLHAGDPETLRGEAQMAGRRSVEPAIGVESEAAQEAPNGFAGLVLDAQSGSPLPLFRIALLPERTGNEFQEPLLKDFEAGDGRFVWEGLPPRAYYAFVHAEGHALAHLGRFALDSSTVIDLGEVLMTQGGSVGGHVVDEATGNPIPGALVLSDRDAPSFGLPFDLDQMSLWLPASVHSRADGSFLLDRLSAGRHSLRITAPGYAPAWLPAVAIGEGQALGVEPVALGPGGTLEGIVKNADGTAFVGAKMIVSLMDGQEGPQLNFALAETDLDGRYRVEHLPPGYLLTIFLGDFSTPPKVQPVQIMTGKVTTLDLPAEQVGGEFRGRVLEADGTPLAERNLTIMLSETGGADTDTEWKATSTDREGRFVFDDLEPGDYVLLEVDSFGNWLSLIERVDVPRWQEQELEIRRSVFAIEGQSLTDVEGEPLPGSLVIVERLDADDGLFAGFVRTDGQGRFALRSLPAGRYALTCYATVANLGFESKEPFLLDDTSPRQELIFRHAPGGTLDIRVTDIDGRAVQNAFVSLDAESGRKHWFGRTPLTDEKGRHEAIGVRPGRYRIHVEHDDFQDAFHAIECRAGHEDPVQIELTPRED